MGKRKKRNTEEGEEAQEEQEDDAARHHHHHHHHSSHHRSKKHHHHHLQQTSLLDDVLTGAANIPEDDHESEGVDDFDPVNAFSTANWMGPADGGDVALQGTSVYSTIPLDEIKKRKKKHDPNCFGCRYTFGKPTNPTEYHQMNELYSAFVENRNKISFQALAELLSALQYKLFVEPFINKTLPPNYVRAPSWPAEKVIEHLLYHANLYEFDLESDYSDITELYNQTKNLCVRKSQIDQTESIDPQMVDIYMKLLKTKQLVYTKLFNHKKGSI
jgi:hypothetical protein